MKFIVTFKSPDAVNQALEDSVPQNKRKEVKSLLEKWIKWEEYLDVEVDTETKKIRVLEQ